MAKKRMGGSHASQATTRPIAQKFSSIFGMPTHSLAGCALKVVAAFCFAYLFCLATAGPYLYSSLNSMVVMALYCFLLALFLAPVVLFVFYLINRIAWRNDPKKFSVKLFFALWAILIVCWIAAYLVLYPGISTTDSCDIYKMILGYPFESLHFRYSSFNTHHPAFYVWLDSLVLVPTQAIGFSLTQSIALLVFIYFLILSSASAYFVARIYEFSGSKALLVFCVAFFGLNPIFMFYSCIVWKDVIFCSCFLVFLVELLGFTRRPETCLSKKWFIVRFALISLCCCLLRSNGLIPILITLIVLVACFRKFWKKLLSILAAVLCSFLLITQVVYPLAGASPAHFSETVGVPLQQIGRTVQAGGTLTEEQAAFLEEIMPLEDWAECYNQKSPDSLKFSENFNDEFFDNHKMEVITTWLSMAPANLRTYFEAWAEQTRSLWNIDTEVPYVRNAGFNVDGQTPERMNLLDGLISEQGLRFYLDLFIQTFPWLFNMAFVSWSILFLGLGNVLSRRYYNLWVFLPVFAYWFTFMLAIPAGDFGYFFPIFATIPLIVYMGIVKPDPRDERRKSRQFVSAGTREQNRAEELGKSAPSGAEVTPSPTA